MTIDAYLDRWFLTRAAFNAQLPIPDEDVECLITAGAIPGAIYGALDDTGWWSALSVEAPVYAACVAQSTRLYYTPAALWWARRALLTMPPSRYDPASAAAQNRRHFVDDFVRYLSTYPLARSAYPSCFDISGLIETQARLVANQEWDSWIDGGYGVCLRRFSAETCIRKESLASHLRQNLADPEGHPLTPLEIFDAVEELEGLMLPFAPFERPSGTPGKIVDRFLDQLSLGRDLPYG